MPTPTDHIERLLVQLDGGVPALLRSSGGMEFWIEYLQRADNIKEQAGLDNYGWVAARIDEIPLKYGVLPPSHWVCC